MSFASLSRSQSVSDEQQYRLLYAGTFLFFLVAAVCGRAVSRMTGRPRAADLPRSIVAEARAAGSNALLFAFLG